LSFAVAVEYTLPLVFPILRVDSDDKRTGCTAGSLTVAHVSWDGNRKAFEGKVEKARCVRIFGEERCNCSINDRGVVQVVFRRCWLFSTWCRQQLVISFPSGVP
jgi:hypothetical protein